MRFGPSSGGVALAFRFFWEVAMFALAKVWTRNLTSLDEKAQTPKSISLQLYCHCFVVEG
jgi:hypothetical protein